MKEKKDKRKISTFMMFGCVVFLLSLALNGYFVWRFRENNRVTAVIDGDSLELSDGRRIRLLGIDTPERGRCMADIARRTLSQAALGKHIRLKETVTDGYGRILAIVIVSDVSDWLNYFCSASPIGCVKRDPLLNRLMVEKGLARYTFSLGAKSVYRDTLKAAGVDAKDKSFGIWSPACRNQDPKGDCLIKGNSRDGKKFYHLPTCDNYDQVIVDESYGDSWFCTEKEAQSAGFIKATGCR